MKFCSTCVLPDTFPGIDFDANGTCNYCRHFQLPDEQVKREYANKYEDLLNRVRGKHEYDVIMAYSGGKDSTYILYQLARVSRLNVLAFTFDNGFLSEKARENITRMVDYCEATGVVVRPAFSKMKRIFRVAATEDIFNTKTLDRASSICTACIGHVKALVLKTALEKNIPLVAYGWTPGQAPITSSIMRTGPGLQVITQKTIRDPILKRCGELRPYFLSETDLQTEKERWPTNVHPLAFMDYGEEKITQFIKSVGWEQPLDTDPNSSNCILNALANYLHRRRFKFHPYAWEIAGIVRAGGISRQQGIIKTTEDESPPMVKYAAELLDVDIR